MGQSCRSTCRALSKYPPKLQELVDTLAMFTDRSERIDALVDLGSRYDASANKEVPRTRERRVPGCESEVYIDAHPMGDGLKFRFAIDNPQGISAMALADLLDEGLSGQPLREVADVPDDLVYDVFGRELSMGKSMGLMGMVRMVKAEAFTALMNT